MLLDSITAVHLKMIKTFENKFTVGQRAVIF